MKHRPEAAAPHHDGSPAERPAKAARRPARSSDPRAMRSRDLLRDALLRMIRVQPLEKITLRDIAQAAGVSYPTIFNHYASREELFQDVARSEIAGLLDAFRQGRDSDGWQPGRDVTTYILDRRELWRTLLTTGASDAMRAEFVRRGRTLAQDHAELGHGIPIDVVSGVIASGIFEVASWWLTQPTPDPMPAVAGMLERLVIEPALNLPRGYFGAGSGGGDTVRQRRSEGAPPRPGPG